jgi:hypothetical protein
MTNYVKNVKNDIMNLICEDCDKFKDINYTLAVENQIEDIIHKRLDELFITIREQEYDNKNIYGEKEKV